MTYGRVILRFTFLACIVSAARAAKDIYTISAELGSAATPTVFALAELSARLEACKTPTFDQLDQKLQADCILHLISPLAECAPATATDGSSSFVCDLSGAVFDTADIGFSCNGTCPHQNATLKAMMDAEMDCGVNIKEAKDGFLGDCYVSAYCLLETEGTIVNFGDFCPSHIGEYCCESGVIRDNGFFPGVDALHTTDTYRGIDHMVNMDLKITYDIKAPAQLQLKVEVPYVESTSTMTYEETDGTNVTREMCPTTYLIDLLPPVDTYPGAEPPLRIARTKPNWRPLKHFPEQDLIGRPRSTCGNYDMNYENRTDFVTHFKFPDEASNVNAYGQVPSVPAGVWDVTQGTVGIPHDGVTFWHKGSPVGSPGEKRITYTTGDQGTGHFDLVKAWTKCRNIDPSNPAQLVKKQANSDDTFINGVSYPVDTYEWILSVCSVGYFGANCRTRTDPQMYAKTCIQVPATFSVTPQQISHVVVAPITEQLVSKAFLQAVDGFPSDCPSLHERVAITLNLVIFSTDYDIASTEEVHDLLSPLGVFEQASDATNFNVLADDSTMDQLNFREFLESETGAGRNVGQGVYVLNKRENGGVVSVYYRKVIIVTKCYLTNVNIEKGTRASPAVFAESITDPGADNVLFDLEIIVEKTRVQPVIDGVFQDLPAGTKIQNTLNLRILATKQTFILPTLSALKQKPVSAYQKLYGSYASARADNTPDLTGALVRGAVMSAGDQMCSKHQLESYDSQVANLIPNAVGACMLKLNIPAWAKARAGTTIYYRTTGMSRPIPYTYGCFPDWINVDGLTPVVEGILEVFVFSGQVPRQVSVHDSIFWFVQKQELESTRVLNAELMKDRFGAALFYYNTTSQGAGVTGGFVVEKSDQFQAAPSTAFVTNPAGCVTDVGALKSSCNLVCFDIVDGLLTDPNAAANRDVLVHHVSVATVATEADQGVGNKFSPARKRNRMLLESVTRTVDPTLTESIPASSGGVVVKPGAYVTDVGGEGTQVEATVDSDGNVTKPVAAEVRDIDGPSMFAPLFFPLMFIFISVAMSVIGSCYISKRYNREPKQIFDKFTENEGNQESLLGGTAQRRSEARRSAR